MGFWGSGPFDNDHAVDWFDNEILGALDSGDATELATALKGLLLMNRSKNIPPPAAVNVLEIRAAASLLSVMGKAWLLLKDDLPKIIEELEETHKRSIEFGLADFAGLDKQILALKSLSNERLCESMIMFAVPADPG